MKRDLILAVVSPAAAALAQLVNTFAGIAVAAVSIAWMLRRWYLSEKGRGKCSSCPLVKGE